MQCRWVLQQWGRRKNCQFVHFLNKGTISQQYKCIPGDLCDGNYIEIAYLRAKIWAARAILQKVIYYIWKETCSFDYGYYFIATLHVIKWAA